MASLRVLSLRRRALCRARPGEDRPQHAQTAADRGHQAGLAHERRAQRLVVLGGHVTAEELRSACNGTTICRGHNKRQEKYNHA